MTLILGYQFEEYSIPLSFANRYFILESAPDGLKVSVLLDLEEAPVFDILKNEPVGSPHSNIVNSVPGVFAVKDNTGRPVYQLQIGAEARAALTLEDGSELEVRFSGDKIQAGKLEADNTKFGGGIGVKVSPEGTVGIGNYLPYHLLKWFV
ncbi:MULTISPECIES: hypothetical protein [Paenibacillus]|uniref:Uncharacterized protein n=1 Tax=Paenibacillus rhizophilus TaxID=1850366 RepID=A0A3N9P9G8_9BACL|nr:MULTISPECIES: hypothetical protein [Paenibacillus]RQW11694.1 hypothetical protein EH198_11845 [Paenibacillus rhizophilus]BCG60319.1 hypothetical protein PUR_37440 [Paenibacillus sp. URB8-2]